MAQDVRKHHKQQSENLKGWLRLSLMQRKDTQRLCELILNNTIELSALNVESIEELSRYGISPQQLVAFRSVTDQNLERCLEWCQQQGNFILTQDDPDFPDLLKTIHDPPAVVFGCGDRTILNLPQIAVVGSRTPTLAGLDITKSLAAELSSCGWVITSGLALGIDAAAHAGALQAGGRTIAVMGCGVDVPYPRRNIKLRSEILDRGGCLISELPPGSPPRAENFPRRNRIVSGMSLGSLVTEAKCKSGSLITARMALEQNRDVFAVPGSIRNPMSEGCHYLLSQGAKLVSGVKDINEEYQHLNFQQVKNLQKNDGDYLDSVKLLDSVDSEVTALDVVVERSKLPISILMAKLLQLELRGLVASVPGGYVKLGGK